MRKLVLCATMFFVRTGFAFAVIAFLLDDEFDDTKLIQDVFEQKDVVQFRQRIDNFEKKLLPLKERDVIALFGKSQGRPAKTYAMPVAQYRGLTLSGIRYGDEKLNRDHVDFYIIKDLAGLEVFYHIDGVSPAAIVLYFPADKEFPKLTKDNLAKRLAWDEDHFKKFLSFYEKRMKEVFPWEVDPKELAKLQQGDFAVDTKAKLEAWIASSKALGYKYQHKEGSDTWEWYRPDGTLARQVRSRGEDKDRRPVEFYWYHEDGKSELRKETFGYQTGHLESRRWCRAKTTLNIRYETPDSWCWYGKDEKPVRIEWDDNGDGIPDWYVTKEDLIEHAADRKAMEKRKPLKLEESWAIHPKLIPEESRISDQPELRVPIRPREASEPPKK